VGLALPALGARLSPDRRRPDSRWATPLPCQSAEPGEAACHYDASAKFWADSHREQALVIFVAM